MTVQDLFLTPYSTERSGISVSTALLIGMTLAVGLFWLAQGSDSVPSGPHWHDNVGFVANDS